LAVPDRFDIVRERLPADLGEVVTGAMARAGYRPTREAPAATGPYRRPADGLLHASFEPDPAARPRTMGQVQVRQEDERTLRVEIAFPPVRIRWRAVGWGACLYGASAAMFAAIHQFRSPRWVEFSWMMLPTLLIGPWVLRRMAAVPPSQVYRVILDAIAEALDDAKRVRIEAAASEDTTRSEADEQPETAVAEDGAGREERRQG
jgi:hypothetical protein